MGLAAVSGLGEHAFYDSAAGRTHLCRPLLSGNFVHNAALEPGHERVGLSVCRQIRRLSGPVSSRIFSSRDVSSPPLPSRPVLRHEPDLQESRFRSIQAPPFKTGLVSFSREL